MSLVIQKFEPGGKTTQPRLYKRGNDDIDLDAYIRDAESEFSYWLANSRLKDKEKQQVQEAYSKMLQGINDGTFTYKIGGGYNNSVGMSNKAKGFDAAGLAAGFLGNILRNQSVYKAAEEKPDPSKIEWKGNASVGSALVRHLYGSDKESLNDFIDLDPYDTKTKKRGNINRSGRFKSGLEYIRDNFDNLFTSFTDSDKATALERINSALSAFDNGTVEDNEYLDLGRATGMSNLRDMFFAGEGYSSTPDKAAPGTVAPGANNTGVYTNEDEWRSAKYPRLNTKVVAPIHLTDSAKYGAHSRLQLDRHLNTLSKDDLLDVVRSITVPNLYNHPKLRDKAASWSHVPFSNKYIVLNALKVLKDKGYLNGYADSSGNNFYIHGSYNKKRGTGLVWNMGSNTISETNIYDIPWWITKMHNEFTAQIPSSKNGGTLLKFLAGGWFENLYKQKALKNWNLQLRNDNWNAGTTFHGHANDLTSAALTNAAYTSDLSAVGQDINSFIKTFDTNLTPEQIVSLYNDNAEKIRGFWNGEDVDYNSTDATEHNRLFSKMFLNRSKTSGGNSEYNLSYDPKLEKQAGSLTWLRRMDRYEKEFDQLTPEEQAKRTFTVTRIINGRPLVFEVYKKANGNIALRNDLTDIQNQIHSDILGEIKTNPNLGLTNDEKLKRAFGTDVDEKYITPNLDTPKTNSLGELTPDLIDAGRLWASLHTNNRVYNTVLPSLKPVLKDTYERYSPVTGAFSAMQLKNRQGADVMRQSNQAFTSDASLAAARMLEGQRQSNLLQAEGFLADDQEIRRTQAEALARLEDNMARRSEVTNFNRASINQTNRERAQLEATRLKSNWQSWDNFLQGFESRIRTRMDENRERANNFYDKLSANQAEEWYNTVMEPANRAFKAWANNPDNVGKDPSTEWEGGREWLNYVKHKDRARAMANAMIYQGMADRYGLSYSNPYTRESYSLMDWNRRYV